MTSDLKIRQQVHGGPFRAGGVSRPGFSLWFTHYQDLPFFSSLYLLSLSPQGETGLDEAGKLQLPLGSVFAFMGQEVLNVD